MRMFVVFRQWFFDIPKDGPGSEEAWTLARNCGVAHDPRNRNYSDGTRTFLFSSDADIPKELLTVRSSFRVDSRIGIIEEELGLLRRVPEETIGNIADYVGLTPTQRQRLFGCFRTPNVLMR